MSNQTPPRQMFPESRLTLGTLSPVLGVFFAVCIYFTSVWEPSTAGDRIGKFFVMDILFTFITLCGVGFIASVVGPHRVRPLIMRVGGRAARAGFALMLGTAVYMLYYFSSIRALQQRLARHPDPVVTAGLLQLEHIADIIERDVIVREERA